MVTQDLLLAIPLPCCKVRACLLVGRMFSQAVSPSCPLVGATTRTWALPSPAPRLVLFSAGRVQRLPPGARTPRLSVGAACRGFGGSASDSLPSENNHSRHYGARVPCIRPQSQHPYEVIAVMISTSVMRWWLGDPGLPSLACALTLEPGAGTHTAPGEGPPCCLFPSMNGALAFVDTSDCIRS